ncbi:MAG: hypothetical protein Q9195_006005 [Heterodermia aff. obscurata]
MSSLAAAQPVTYHPYSDDERNDAASEQESAPLLDLEGDQPVSAASPESKTVMKATRILTSLTLCFSILAVMLLIANKILTERENNPGYGYPMYQLYWPTRAGSRAVGITAVFSIIISAYNLTCLCYYGTVAPLIINFLFDVLVGCLVIAYAVPGLANIGGTLCFGILPIDREKCQSRALPSRIVIGLALLFGIIYGFLHLAMLALRCHTALKSNANSRTPGANWKFPFGQLKFESSIKLLREPERSTRGQEQ